MQGKQIKDYIVGSSIFISKDMQLFEAKKTQQQLFSLIAIEKGRLDQNAFVQYHNLLVENKVGIHPRYVEPIQSSNNVYIVLEHLRPMPQPTVTPKKLLPSLIDLYRRAGQFRLDMSELFMTESGKVVYLPFYRNLHTTSKFYAQFHNKSILAQALSPSTPIPHNKLLDIFVNNIDHPDSLNLILSLIEKEMGQQLKQTLPKSQDKSVYPSLDEEDDEEILRLMGEARVNNELKQEAGMFQRQSVRRFEEEADKELNQIMEQAKSSMSSIKKGVHSQLTSHIKSKIEVKLSKGGVKISKGEINLQTESSEFEVYFISYHQTLRFMKRAVRVFLEYYRNGFAGIVSSFLVLTALVLRKACMIRDLEMRLDVFELGINMHKIAVGKYTALLGRDLRGDSKMLAELRVLLQNCEMPIKTYTILAPFLDDISALELEQVQSFLFFFLSALMRGRERGKLHFIYFIDVMYVSLHGHYQIAFFEDDFPNKWDQDYFDQKVMLIQALLPGWHFK